MDLEPIVWMVVGAGLAAARILPLVKVSIHTKAFAAQIVKLLDGDTPSRALMLCGAAPNAPTVRIVQATLEAARELPALAALVRRHGGRALKMPANA